jgi:hypothetical protein
VPKNCKPLCRTHTIAYETVWKGKEKVVNVLYGSWEESFQLLFWWKEVVIEKMPDSIIEINIHVE